MEERFELFTALILNIGRCIRKIKSEEMEEFQLKSYHVSCLYYLYKEKSLTAKALCELCEEDKANVSRALDELEALGYLADRGQTGKRYRRSLRLSDKGLEVGAHLMRKIDTVLQSVSDGLDEEHRRVMYESLSLLSTNLQKKCDEYHP